LRCRKKRLLGVQCIRLVQYAIEIDLNQEILEDGALVILASGLAGLSDLHSQCSGIQSHQPSFQRGIRAHEGERAIDERFDAIGGARARQRQGSHFTGFSNILSDIKGRSQRNKHRLASQSGKNSLWHAMSS
jgi:hypothetical protein